MAPAERRKLIERFLGEMTLARTDFIRALSTLDPQVAAIGADAIFHEYATSIAAARDAAILALYGGDGEQADLPAVSSGELVAIARRTAEAFVAATSAAATELSQAAANAQRPAAEIEADLLRVLAARGYRHSLTAYADDVGYDTLIDFDQARRADPRIGRAADAAEADEPARSARDAAIAAYREIGTRLARAVVAKAGASAAATRTRWGGQDEPAEVTEILSRHKQGAAQWQDANEALADAFERFLLSGGDAQAAARWRLRSLAATVDRSILVFSSARALLDGAILLGVSEQELAPLRAALDEAAVAQVERMKATLAAHRRWIAELKAAGLREGSSEPSEALLAAHERQMALDRSLCQRVLTSIGSPLVREALSKMPSPEAWVRAPYWLQKWREEQRAAQAPAPGNAVEGAAPR